MRILLVSATESEIRNSLRAFAPSGERRFLKGNYKDHTVEVLFTGVGMFAMAYHLGRTLALNSYDLVINAGIAGSFKKEYAIGSVVNVVKEVFSEFGAEDRERFIPMKNLEVPESLNYPFEEEWLINKTELKVPSIEKLAKVKGLTVNTVHGNEDSIKKVVKLYNPDVESMEGASFLYACLNKGIPCLQIRAISNFVTVRNKEEWKIPLALDHLNVALIKLLDEV